MHGHPIGEAPVCVAALVCDVIIEDARTGNRSAIGIFNTVQANKLPATHPRMFLLVSLTNASGTEEFQIILRGPNGKTLVDLTAKIENCEPLATYDIPVELQGLQFDDPGEYQFEVLHGPMPIGGRRFQVRVAPASGHQ